MIHTPIRTGAILTGALAITLGLGACTFVPVTTEGQHVRVATASDVRNCQRLGSTTVTITEKVGFVRRPRRSSPRRPRPPPAMPPPRTGTATPSCPWARCRTAARYSTSTAADPP